MLAKMLVLLFVTALFLVADVAALSQDYYQATCPQLESIVWNATQLKVSEAPTSAAATVRLFFHDCFIEGCDGSILITSTSGNVAERDATVNSNLAGDAFDAVVRVKAAVEAECPGVVSCADILAMATRNFVVLRGGPMYPVELGRLDGLVSMASRVGNNIPQPNVGLQQLIDNFAQKGLDANDLVTLSGAHTFGFAHCNQFSNRLYGFSASNGTDPSLDSNFAGFLKQACPVAGVNPDLVEPFDATTPFTFDNLYYQELLGNTGLLSSDQALLDSSSTQQLVQTYASSSDAFNQAFTSAMQRLGSIGVKTAGQGEVRRDCTKFNNQ